MLTLRKGSLVEVLGGPTLHPFAPHTPAGGLHLTAHHHDNLRLCKAELHLYGLKWSPVLPRHLDDPIDITVSEALVEFFCLHDPIT